MWTIIDLEEDFMVINNVTKFYKIPIKIFHLREGTSLGVKYIGNRLTNVPPNGHFRS